MLFIEATLLPGNQNIILTGQLGNVMQESARAALSHLGLMPKRSGFRRNYAKHDLHVHVPAGAILKTAFGCNDGDGDSVGGENTPVRQDVAMTGEITLSGLVLPVGESARSRWRHVVRDQDRDSAGAQ